ncbi:hypothetical protein JG688_00004057 [Phytophthora aleatoria]|uniref:Uncharacterized protein n=1 Tax=Phytophthora aleatoria TaxID=2496075 RepID=A0A8J5JEC2_9STRA|nr:hypothetical protein JG688_00004057 [Phytophthora aleatoria]
MDEMSFYFDCIAVMTDDEDVGVGVDVVRKVGKRLMVTLTTKATGLADREKYYCDFTAWMTREIFCQWLKSWNQELVNSGRHHY